MLEYCRSELDNISKVASHHGRMTTEEDALVIHDTTSRPGARQLWVSIDGNDSLVSIYLNVRSRDVEPGCSTAVLGAVSQAATCRGPGHVTGHQMT